MAFNARITSTLPIPFLLFISFPGFSFEFEQNEITGSFDTTISLGALYRTQDPSSTLIDRHNGGATQNALNNDDGDLNFDKGFFSSALKVTHDLQINYQNYGGFFRGSYFYDHLLANKDELTDVAKKDVAYDIELLDAYVFGEFHAGEHNLEVRAGNQVVNWGESTFIPNGINIVNPIDVSKFRVPGAEIREALIPTPMLWGSAEINENVSVEGFYLFRFQHFELDPRGTYFSDNDVISPGSDHLVAGFGVANEDGNVTGLPSIFDNAFIIPRGSDKNASDSGEFGLALRLFAPELNQTEFGFYFINYHSRLPIISFVAGVEALPPTGGPATAQYYVEYPEDIHLLGLSFNTISNATGIAIQGEVSYRDNVPLQIELAEVAMAATHTSIANNPANGYASQLGHFTAGDVIQGYKRLGMTQAQITATKAFGRVNPFWADQWQLLTEVGMTKVHDMPKESELRFEAAGTNMPARDDIVVAGRAIPAQDGGWAEDFGWGYRLLTQTEYNNVIGATHLLPRLVFSHDVSGTTPGPGGNFIESRKAITVGLGASYLEKWLLDLSYTKFFHAEGHNSLADRDFIGMSIKYGF